MKTFEKGGFKVTMADPTYVGGPFAVILLDSSGRVINKIKRDTKREANEYFRAFSKIAEANGAR